MRIFGFSIIRAKAMDRVHARTKELLLKIEHLEADVKSYKRSLLGKDEKIEQLEKKCSLVNVSALQNEIGRLNDEKELSGNGLRNTDWESDGVLRSPLVQLATTAAEGDFDNVQDEGDGLPESLR